MDSYTNFATSVIAVAPAPATTGLTLTLESGTGDLFPDENFVCFTGPPGTPPASATTEILYVTSRDGDVLTLDERGAQGSVVQQIAAGWEIYHGFSAKTWNDIVTLVEEGHLPTVHHLNGSGELAWGTDNYVDVSGGSIVLTLPSAVGAGGRQLFVKVISAGGNTCTLDPHAGQTINGSASLVLSSEEGEAPAPFDAVTVKSDNANCQIA